MADAALSALLSLASHELRGPTGVLRGYLKMLDQDPTLGERPRRVVGDATRAADRLVTLLDEIAELARLKDEALRPTLRSMSLRSILNQAVQAVTLPPGYEVKLDVVAPADVRRRVDEARLRAVFETLIFTLVRGHSGAATIDLRLVKGRASTLITVTPQTLGHGAVIDRPLDPTRGGTGLRLPIAEAVVQAHGGRLRERWIAGRWAGFAVKLT
ncbi:MAG: HAMP domain-containing sensor histidine kinase [Acidobacteriota bacterium]|nr:HAMP domain-containing sensor histidine kinase [Acidobacteriota bacterium]